MFAYYTRRLSIAKAAKIWSLFCCLNLLIVLIDVNTIESVRRLRSASATIKASKSQYDRQPVLSLSGEQAETWLKQQGIFHSLQSSIDSSSYQMQWADGAYQSVNPAQNLSARFTR